MSALRAPSEDSSKMQMAMHRDAEQLDPRLHTRVAAKDTMLARTGWQQRMEAMSSSSKGCGWCKQSLAPANDSGALYDADGMLKDQRRRERSILRMMQLNASLLSSMKAMIDRMGTAALPSGMWDPDS